MRIQITKTNNNEYIVDSHSKETDLQFPTCIGTLNYKE